MLLTQELVTASRLQFGLTAMYHWLFVPLTLGLGFLIAIMETKYYISKDEFWKKTTQFWSRIFAINFACGVATGIILEFEFGTNWSNYSWFVGDIFGAPLAIEGIFAFFMESTFFAVMYFGWGKVSKGFHLTSTWLTACGAAISALWILAANAWMQYPAGMQFNPATARSEMVNFWAVAFSPVALNKFSHSITFGFVLGSIVVIGISSWYLLRNRDQKFARKSIKYASVFGLISCILLCTSGHKSAVAVSRYQPMKLAAMEGLYNGQKGTPLVGVGIINPAKTWNNNEQPYLFNISIPKGLSILTNCSANSFVPGISDIINGGYEYMAPDGSTKVAVPFAEKVKSGRIAIKALEVYNQIKDQTERGANGQKFLDETKKVFDENFENFGYGYMKNPEESIPPVAATFYSFRVMICLAVYFLLFLIISLLMSHKDGQAWDKKDDGKRWNLEKNKWFLVIAIISVPLAYICGECGWLVAEIGRQPWTIQDLLPVNAAVSGVSASNVYTTFIIFLVLFTTLLIAELRIIFNQIGKGPDGIKW